MDNGTNPGMEKLQQHRRALVAFALTTFVLITLMLLTPPAFGAGVGLPESPPDYQRVAQSNSAQPEQAADVPFTIKPISHGKQQASDGSSSSAAGNKGADLSCDQAGRLGITTLDMALPENPRADTWHSVSPDTAAKQPNHGPIIIPMYIEASSAFLRVGTGLSTASTTPGPQGSMGLLSRDRDYFSKLLTLRPQDTLLVQTAGTIRHYRITDTYFTQPGTKPKPALSGTLTLAACYPFQPVVGAPVLYVVRAQPVPTQLPQSTSEEGGTHAKDRISETVSF